MRKYVEEITIDKIKQKLLEIEQKRNGGKLAVHREMVTTPIQNMYGEIGTIIFSLNGSPPKGIAICNGNAYSNVVIAFFNQDYERKGTWDSYKFPEREIICSQD